MRKLLLLAALAITAAAPASQAQGVDTGVRTETQERMLSQQDPNLPYNVIGLFGLLGLLGLRRGHDEDSYHPAPLD